MRWNTDLDNIVDYRDMTIHITQRARALEQKGRNLEAIKMLRHVAKDAMDADYLVELMLKSGCGHAAYDLLVQMFEDAPKWPVNYDRAIKLKQAARKMGLRLATDRIAPAISVWHDGAKPNNAFIALDKSTLPNNTLDFPSARAMSGHSDVKDKMTPADGRVISYDFTPPESDESDDEDEYEAEYYEEGDEVRLDTFKHMPYARSLDFRSVLTRMEQFYYSGDGISALAIARRYLRFNKGDPVGPAMEGWAHMIDGDARSAIDGLVSSMAMKQVDARVLAVAAQILMRDDPNQTETAIAMALNGNDDPMIAEMLMISAARIGAGELVMRAADQLLVVCPYEPEYVIYRAVAQLRGGGQRSDAHLLITDALNLFPDDEVLKYYSSRTSPDATDGDINYPEYEMYVLWSQLATRYWGRDYSALGDPLALAALQWGLNYRFRAIYAESCQMLMRCQQDGARRILLGAAHSPRINDAQRREIIGMMAEQGCEMPKYFLCGGILTPLISSIRLRIQSDNHPDAAIRHAARRVKTSHTVLCLIAKRASESDIYRGLPLRYKAHALVLASAVFECGAPRIADLYDGDARLVVSRAVYDILSLLQEKDYEMY